MDVLSALRAYVGGEGLWSKAQQDAVMHLREYARSGDRIEMQAFRKALQVPIGDRIAREELQKPDFDPQLATAGFFQGRNDPGDIPGMIRLFRLGSGLPQMREAIEVWTGGDELIAQLDALAGELDALWVDGVPGPAGVRAALDRINHMDSDLRRLEIKFSAALGNASRSATSMVLWGASVLSTLFLGFGIAVSRAILLRQRAVEAELRSSQDRVRNDQRRAQVTLDSIHDGVITTSAQEQVEYLNAVAERLTGWSAAQARGRALGDVLHLVSESGGERQDPSLLSRESGSDGSFPLRDAILVHRSGRKLAVTCSIAPIRDGGQAHCGSVIVMRDVSTERELSLQLLHQATHDELTGLANRRQFESRLEALITSRDAPASALLYLDLDQFKVVNDTCGHPAGDQLIRMAADTVRSTVRSGDIVARLGGDEFGLLLVDCAPGTAGAIAEKIRASLAELPFMWQGRPMLVSASIGLVHLDGGFPSVAEALSAADSACYLAKDAGRNRVQVYRDDDRKFVARSGEMNFVSRIADALAQSRFRLFAQRIEPVSDDTLETRYEILLRMVEPDGRLLSPGNFIPAAERYGLMPRLDRWVIEHSIRAMADLRKAGQALPWLVVNISATSIDDGELFAFIKRSLAEAQIPPQRISFELTETTAIAHLRNAMRLMRALHSLGCSIGLDDFGAGMSSYSYLRRLPVDYIKIDGRFVVKMDTDPVDRAMVASIHQVAQVMGLRTVAEWIESDAVLAAVREIGIDYAQGYAVHRPDALEAVLQAHPATVAA
jgi:diguanylate cyclase (GGDEF)-like protein/PAS domain S-box-containing protein